MPGRSERWAVRYPFLGIGLLGFCIFSIFGQKYLEASLSGIGAIYMLSDYVKDMIGESGRVGGSFVGAGGGGF